MGRLDRFVEAYAEFCLRRRWLILAVMGSVVAISCVGVAKLRFDTSFRVWQPPDSPHLAAYESMLAKFGSDDSLVIAFRDPNGVLTNTALDSIRRLTDALWRVDGVKRVDSLANFSLMRASNPAYESPAVALTTAHLAAAGDRNDIVVWDRKTFAARRLAGHDALVEHLATSPDGRLLYSAGLDRTVRIYDLTSGELLRVLRGARESVSALLVAPDGKRIYVGSYQSIVVFDTDTGKAVAKLASGEDFITALALEGQKLYAASRGIEAWDLAPATPVREARLEGHSGSVTAMLLSRDGKTLYSAGDDGLVAAWDLATRVRATLIAQPKAQALTLAAAPGGRAIVAGFSDGTIRSLPLEASGATLDTKARAIVTRIHDDWVTDVAIAPDGRVFSTSRDRNAAMHIPGQGPRSLILSAHRGAVRRVAFDPQTEELFTIGDDGDTFAWNTKTYEVRARLTRITEEPAPVAHPLTGPPNGKLEIRNGFRFPLDLRVGGSAHGSIPGASRVDIADIPMPPKTTCEDDEGCSPGQFCDLEGEQATCTTRAVVEAVLPGTDVRVWIGTAALSEDRTVTINIPSEDPFSVPETAEAPPDPRGRVAALLAAFPGEDLSRALDGALGPGADPDSFLSAGPAEAVRLALAPSAPQPLQHLLGTLAQAQVSTIQLPIQPFRLRESAYYMMRGPKPPALHYVLNEKLDSTALTLTLRIDDVVNPLDQSAKIRGRIEAVMAEESARTGYAFHLAGDAVRDTTFQRFAERDIRQLFPMFILMIMTVLLLWYRRPSGVVLPLGLILISDLITMGIGGFLGYPLDNMTVAVPQVVLACCIGDATHVFNHYVDALRHGHTREEAIKGAITTNLIPCFWTSSTTTLGFFSLIMQASIQPIANFGMLGGIGAMVAWVGTFTVMPCIMSMLPQSKKLQQAQAARRDPIAETLDRGMVAISRYVYRNAPTVIFMGGVLVAVATYGMTKVSFDTNALEFFSKDSPFRQASDFIEENLTGPYNIQLMVDTGEPGGIRKVENLEKLAKLQDHLESMPDLTSVSGIADMLKGMNRVMQHDLEENYRLPPTDREASGYYNLYTFSLPAGLELTNRVSVDESLTLVSVQIKNRSSGWIVAWGHELARWAETNLPGMTVVVTGKSWLFSQMLSDMAATFFADVGQAVISISITLFLLARLWRLGLIAMIVNVLPLFVTVGLASLAGVTLDISVIVACTAAMGIVVDDTIHYVAKYKRMRQHGADHQTATETLAHEHSKASVATMLILICGFLIFAFTDYMVNRNFGLITAAMLTIGAVFDLLVHPAMLKLWGPKVFPAAAGAAPHASTPHP